ncbi:MAG: uracil-DNA glycosylase [Candidatus Hydrogenedentes bacterium]|nr:uracil-DNA glycosylase [Candidatus Hydrogenedentota bacterium]
MTSSELLTQIIGQTRELVARAAHPKRGTIALSPETAAFFTPVAESPAVLFEPPEPLNLDAVASLDDLARIVSECRRCALCETRTQTVFSDGNARAGVAFVGEAPGAEEDRTGVPFVGKAGELLTDIIVKGMKLRREDVYICNVLKCRPPNNRDPLPSEKALCEGYLVRQLEFIKPKVICALGKHAANTLLRKNEATGRLRGRWHSYHGIPLRVTYHPAYLLRNPADKKLVWDDIQHVMRVLNGEEDPFAGAPPNGAG